MFNTEGLSRTYFITVMRVIVTGSAAFALTRKELKGRKPIIFYYFITMFVSGGLIPFYIILPLSIPMITMITTLGLFQAVWHWNDWFYGAFYVKDPRLRPLQTFVRITVMTTGSVNRAYIVSGNAQEGRYMAQDPRLVAQLLKMTPESLKQAYLVVCTLPIMLVYPFVQRFFMKGVLIGSIKG